MATHPGSTVVFEPELTRVYSEYSDSEIESFRGLDILPICPVDFKSSEYPVFDGADMMRLENTERSEEGDYRRISGKFSEDSYKCKDHGIEERVPDESEREWARFFSQKVYATQRCKVTNLRAQEKRVADLVWNEDKINPLSVTTAWNNSSSADPKNDVRAAIQMIRENGFNPNCLVITKKQLEVLDECDAIIERIKYTMAAVGTPLTSELLARFFDIERVIVVNSLYNAARKGAAVDKSLKPIWSDDYALVGRIVSPAEALNPAIPGLGRTFLWREDSPSNNVVESYYEEKIRSTIVRARHNVDEKLQSSDCAVLLKGVIVESSS